MFAASTIRSAFAAVRIQPASSFAVRSFQSFPPALRSVYVSNLPWKATEDELASVFEEQKPVDSEILLKVTDVRIIKEIDSGRSRGFVFVEFESDEQAVHVVEKLQGAVELQGRILRLGKPNRASNQRPPYQQEQQQQQSQQETTQPAEVAKE